MMIVRIVFLLFLHTWVYAQDARVPYIDRPEVQAFAVDMARQYGLTQDDWLSFFRHAHYQPRVAELVMPPASTTKKNWQTYQARWIDSSRIQNGLKFWQRYAGALSRAEKDYGVPAEIIVSIIGIETLYGKNMGNFSVLDTLATLAFDYPETPKRAVRSATFREELAHYLAWCQSNHIPVQEPRGSYAGAMGIPQFMPSSMRRYAVSLDPQRAADLAHNPIDAINSIANFLDQHGWESGRPIVWKIAMDASSREVAHRYADGLPQPRLRLKQLLDVGLQVDENIDVSTQFDTLVLIIDLPMAEALPQYFLGLQNFYVLTRYNQSFFYAMSVYELARALRLAKTTQEAASE
ncbi:MAG: lytic murein transglycosylase B [Ottowia sp.]|nr:lytic murein transglycosylase B [Ottowia sp.]